MKLLLQKLHLPLAALLLAALVGQGHAQTWSLVRQSYPGGETDVRSVVLDDQNALYVGTAGASYKSTNGGATWNQTHPQIGTGGSTGSLFDGTNVWLGTGEGGVLKSADRGATWTNTGLDGFGCGVLCIEQIGGKTLLTISGYLRSVYQWNGAAWQVYRAFNEDYGNMTGDDNGWVYLGPNGAGSVDAFRRTTNNGASWQALFPNNGVGGGGYPVRPILVLGNTILIAEPGGRMHRSDSVLNPSFYPVATNLFGSADVCRFLNIPERGVILAAVRNGVIYQSVDVGTTWTQAYVFGGSTSFAPQMRYQAGKLYIATKGAGLHVIEPTVNLTNGLVAYYPFNGNANDVSGNGNNGTVQEAALANDRFTQASRAYSFDGVNDQIVVPHSASVSPTNAVTVAAWIRPLAYEDNKHAVSKGSHVNYFSRSYSLQGPWADGKWRVALSTGTGEVVVASSASAALSQWSHVLMSYDGAEVKLYVNGVLSGTQAATGLITQTSEELFLGSHKFYAASDYWFNGGLDEVRVYNRALSAAEVAQLHASEAVLPPTITAQPANTTANVGASASFNVTATDSGLLSYQWLKNGLSVAGAASATLTLSTLQTNHAGGYSVVIANAAGSSTSSVAILTVNQLSQTLTFAALPGKRVDDAPFTLTATASSGLPVSYSSSDAAVATVSGSTVTITGVGSTTLTASQAGDATYLPATSVNQTLAVAGIPPGISSQPVGIAVNVTSNAAFSVTGTGTAPLTYQWRKEGVNIGGATGAALGLVNVQTNQTANYSVVLANAWGSITSSVAVLAVNRLSQTLTFAALPGKRLDDAPFTLTATASSGLPVSYSSSDAAVATVSGGTVTITGIGSTTLTASQAGDSIYLPTSVNRTLAVAGIPPGISSQPAALALNVTSNAAFSVTGTGTAPLTYQWRKEGVDIGGATGSTLGLLNVQTNQAGSYSVVITNTWGSITSSVAALTVNRLAQTLTFGALAAKRVDDGPFTLSATASSGLPVGFSSSDIAVATVGGTTVTITGIGSTTLTASQAGDSIYLPTSVNRTLAVAGIPPGISSQPAALTVEVTGTAAFGVTATGTAPLAYQWRRDGVDVGGATGSTLGLVNVQTNQAGSYSVVITNAWGSITSSVVALAVNRLAQTLTFGALAAKRVDDAPFILTATANSGLPVSFSSSVTSVATVSGNTVTITGVGSTTLTASQGGNATYLPAGSVSQALVVSAPPAITTPPVGQSFTLGSGLTLSVNAGGTGPLFYQWQFNGTNLTGATSATLTLANLAATNAGAYRVVITNAVGNITSVPVELYFFGDLKFMATTVLAGSVGQQFRVDYADVVTVGTTNWQVLTNITLPSSPFVVVDYTSAGQTKRFYRAVPLP